MCHPHSLLFHHTFLAAAACIVIGCTSAANKPSVDSSAPPGSADSETTPPASTIGISVKDSTTLRLTSTTWKLTELDGRTALAASSREPQLRFNGDSLRVTGSTGCNSLSGSYTVDGDRIKFGPLTMTRMACLDPDANRQEQEFATMLGTVSRWATTKNSLVFLDNQKVIARFESSAAAR